MKLTCQRFSGGNESTLSTFFIDGKFACFVLEDEKRAVKVMGETRIPAGTYKIYLRKEGDTHLHYKTKYPDIHKGMLWLQDVPGFQYVLIHIGNTDIDTKGCLLVGDSAMQNVSQRGSLAGSTSAYERIYVPIAKDLEAGRMVTIEIFDEPTHE